jgi:hypothetical protein
MKACRAVRSPTKLGTSARAHTFLSIHADYQMGDFTLKIAALALSAALLGLMSVTPASAAGAVSPSALSQATAPAADGVTLIAKKRYGKRYRKGHRHGFRPGGRYKKAPPGWRRHSYRPYYWQTRGCIMVGPVWFCP